jgi:hypothetical protein
MFIDLGVKPRPMTISSIEESRCGEPLSLFTANPSRETYAENSPCNKTEKVFGFENFLCDSVVSS